MTAWLENTSTWLVDNGWAPWLFGLLLLVAFAEAAFFLGFVLPGETALIIGGALCATGVWPLAAFLPAAVIAAIVGDSVGYEVGKHYGASIRVSRVGRRIGEPRWVLAETFFTEHGGKAVFLGRSQALLRAMVPALAGMSRLPYRRFLPWNALGALVWGGGVVLLGYVFAHSLSRLETGLKYYAYGALALLVAALVVWLVRRHRAERKALEETAASLADQTTQEPGA